MLTRTDIINRLIEERGYTSYLEIGLDNPFLNFARIKCQKKESIDPFDPCLNFCAAWNDDNIEVFMKYLTYRMTSDDFFIAYPEKKYDIIFIDGLHLETQCDKDIKNALQHINEDGIVVVHDCLPTSEQCQAEENPNGSWVGTVWKSMVKYTQFTSLDIKIIDVDWGVGIIEYSRETNFDIPEKLDMDFLYFNENKFDLLNIFRIKKSI